MKYLFGLAVLVALSYAAWLRFWPRELLTNRDEQTFTAESPMEDVLVVAGQVKPAVTIDLRAEASGIVEFVAVKEGDRVSAGQGLVRLDSKLAQSALRSPSSFRRCRWERARTSHSSPQ